MKLHFNVYFIARREEIYMNVEIVLKVGIYRLTMMSYKGGGRYADGQTDTSINPYITQ